MKCIDAIEGTTKQILDRLHREAVESGCDDSQYVRTVRCVVEATVAYARQNPEIVPDPDALGTVLYEYARRLWLEGQQTAEAPQPIDDKQSFTDDPALEYRIYYYDHLYHRDQYPL